MSNIEQTLSIIKPDAVERNLDNEIKQMFIKNGFNISQEKKIQIEKSEAEKFYKVHETKPFYNDLQNNKRPQRKLKLFFLIKMIEERT